MSHQPRDDSNAPIQPQQTQPSIRDTINDIRDDVNLIKHALTGNNLGQRGVFPRLDEVERKVELHDRKLALWGALAVIAGTVLSLIKDLIFSHK